MNTKSLAAPQKKTSRIIFRTRNELLSRRRGRGRSIPNHIFSSISLILLVLIKFEKVSCNHCSICLDTDYIPYPDAQALPDGTTCRQLAQRTKFIEEDSKVCLEVYQLIGYTKCGCNTLNLPPGDIPDVDDQCTICSSDNNDGTAGSAPNPEWIFDSIHGTSCGQAHGYVARFHKSQRTCRNFQFQGGIECGCPARPLPPQQSPNGQSQCTLCPNNAENTPFPDIYLDDIQQHNQQHLENYFWNVDGRTCGDLERGTSVLFKTDDITICRGRQMDGLEYCGCTPVCSLCSNKQNGSELLDPDLVILDGVTCREVEQMLALDYEGSYKTDNQCTTAQEYYGAYCKCSEITESPSDVPSNLPTVEPSDVPSNLPTVGPSDVPSNLPTVVPSDVPSPAPSFPKRTTTPSNLPTTTFDIGPNCTALAAGIMPETPENSQNNTISYFADVYIADGFSLDGISSSLKDSMDAVVSAAVAGCSTPTASGQQVVRRQLETKIHYLRFGKLAAVDGATCVSTTIIDGSSCFPTQGFIDIIFTETLVENTRRKLEYSEEEANIVQILKDKASDGSFEVNGLTGMVVFDDNSEIAGPNSLVVDPQPTEVSLTSRIEFLVGIGVAGAAVVGLVVFMFVRRTSSDNKEEPIEFFPERNIRSDDASISPIIRQWDESIQSASQDDSSSDMSSSRASFSVQLDETSNGFEATKDSPPRLRGESYLPGSILNDLHRAEQQRSFSVLDTIDL